MLVKFYKTEQLRKILALVCVLLCLILYLVATIAFREQGPQQTRWSEPLPLRVVAPSYSKPMGEIREKRFPQCVVIGFAKCGTRAILTYLRLHPYVITRGPETHFYDMKEFFVKGYGWYRDQMPLSYSNQVTIEKTPAYVITPNAREQMKEHFPNIKLIVLVRDPIVRILSAYAQRITKSPVSLENFYNIEGSDAISENKYPVVVSTYYKHLAPWFDTFNRSQILVLNGDDLISKPLAVMQRVEEFLKIPKLYTDDNFYKNETSGFFCYKGFDENEQVHCLGGSKGRPHETLPADEEKKLYKYFRPHNEKLFSLIQQRFEWPQKS